MQIECVDEELLRSEPLSATRVHRKLEIRLGRRRNRGKYLETWGKRQEPRHHPSLPHLSRLTISLFSPLISPRLYLEWSGTVPRPGFSKECWRKAVERRSRMSGTLVRLYVCRAAKMVFYLSRFREAVCFGWSNVLSVLPPRPAKAPIRGHRRLIAKHGVVSGLGKFGRSRLPSS